MHRALAVARQLRSSTSLTHLTHPQTQALACTTSYATATGQQLRMASTSSSSPSETKGFRLHHTMMRVADKQRSIDFYTRILGMKLAGQKDFEKAKFTLLFFSYVDDAEYQQAPPLDSDERWAWLFSLKGHCVELTWNWEDHPQGGYKSGNEPEHKGFGHICIVVPDVDEACKRFEKEGVTFKKKPQDGTMKGLAFIQDPDGYWIEVVKERGEGKF